MPARLLSAFAWATDTSQDPEKTWMRERLEHHSNTAHRAGQAGRRYGETKRQPSSYGATMQGASLRQQTTVGVSNIPRSAFQTSISLLSLLNFLIHLTKTPERR